MTTLDPDRQKKAKEYARITRRLWLVNTSMSAVYTLVWLIFSWSIALRNWLSGLSPLLMNQWILVPVFVLLFGGIYFLIDLPLSYYSGFILPHRFEQSNQTLKDWIVDQVKGLLVGGPIGFILIELLYFALRATGSLWWLWAVGGLLIFNVLLSNLAPVLIMPIFNKFVPLGEEYKDLAERLLKLAERAHTKVRGVYTFDMSRRTKSANAALTGIGNTRRIVLGDTLINEFTPDEIETVLAHELGHQVHRDIPLLITFGTISTLIGFYLASLAMNWAVAYLGFSSVSDIAAFPALGLILGIYGFLTSPLDNAISRWRERLADEYALQTTGKTEAFASAFVRLANQNLGEIDPEKWVVFLFYSHPPLAERISMAKDWKST
jgi:STE24 endopeptidase